MNNKESIQRYISTEVKAAIAENLYKIIGRRNFQQLAIKHYYVASLLFSNRIFFKDLYQSKGTAISTSTLEKLFKNSKNGSEILNNLQDWGIITMCKNYTEGAARRYKLTPKFECKKSSILIINKTEAPFISTLISRKLNAEKEGNFLIDKQLNTLQKRVSVSQDGINYLINNYPQLSAILTSYDPKKAISIPSEIILSDDDSPLISFLIKDFFCVRPDKESRIYTNFTNLKREHRQFVLLDDKPLIGTDLVNSQLLFTVPLVEAKLKEMNQRAIYIPPADFREFKKLAEEGKAYEAIYNLIKEELKEELGKELPGDLVGDLRNIFKKRFYSDFYFCSLKVADGAPMDNYFRERFPNVHAAIVKIKTDEKHNQFAINCQRKESRILLDKVYHKLLKKRIIALTLHDNIYVSNEKDAAIVKALIEEELYKEHKLKVTVTTTINSNINTVSSEDNELEVKREWISDLIGITVPDDNIVPFNTFEVNLNGLQVYIKETGEKVQLSNTDQLKILIEDDLELSYGKRISL